MEFTRWETRFLVGAAKYKHPVWLQKVTIVGIILGVLVTVLRLFRDRDVFTENWLIFFIPAYCVLVIMRDTFRLVNKLRLMAGIDLEKLS